MINHLVQTVWRRKVHSLTGSSCPRINYYFLPNSVVATVVVTTAAVITTTVVSITLRGS